MSHVIHIDRSTTVDWYVLYIRGCLFQYIGGFCNSGVVIRVSEES